MEIILTPEKEKSISHWNLECPIITIYLCNCHCQLTNFTSPLVWQFLLMFSIHKYICAGSGFFGKGENLVEVKNLKKKPAYYSSFEATPKHCDYKGSHNTSKCPLTHEREKAWWLFRDTLLQCHSKPGFICFPPHCQNTILWCSLLYRPCCPFQTPVFHDSSDTNFTESL